MLTNMTNKETPKVKKYSELTVAERFERIERLYDPIKKTLTSTKITTEEEFFISLHELSRECDRFVRHYFDGTEASDVINNVDILNKVNRIQLMIKVR